MVSNLFLRTVSSVLMVVVICYCVFASDKMLGVLGVAVIFLMLKEWLKATRNQKKMFRMFGMIYITGPMLVWFGTYSSLPHRELFLLCFLGAVCACDIFAFVGGKVFQGPKFAPNISPQKTWSGVCFGVIFSTVIAYYCFSMFVFDDVSAGYKIIFSISIALSTIVGDLLESKVKRTIGIKDMGNIIPGHGGVCDRLDGFLLASWVGFLEIVFFARIL